jgi:superfamily II DNA helicase RecQ
MYQNHTTRLAQLINKNCTFTKMIKFMHIDEAHFIHTAGMDHYGIAAFCAAWGCLGEVCVKLQKSLQVQALSGTQPPHIKETIMKSLLFNQKKLCSIKLSSNHPNMAYATHPIAGALSDMRNLNFLVPDPYPTDYILPKICLGAILADTRISAAVLGAMTRIEDFTLPPLFRSDSAGVW